MIEKLNNSLAKKFASLEKILLWNSQLKLVFPYLKPGYSLNFVKLPLNEDPDSLILSNNIKDLELSFKNKISLIDFAWDNLIFGRNFNTPEKRAALEDEINRLLNLITNFTVKKNYKNFFREKFFNEFRLSGNKKNNKRETENLLNKNLIDTNRITERILIGSVILYPNLFKDINEKFRMINFSFANFNKIKELIIKLISTKKTIENSNIRATLLKSDYRDIIRKIIDKSILLHAPFLNSKNSNKAILEGWNEYLNMYLAKKNKNLISTQANKLLTKLDEENYLKFKETNSYIKKK